MADTIAKLADAAKTLLTILNWKRLGFLAATIILGLLTVGFWENRPMIYSSLSSVKFAEGTIAALSDASKSSIKTIVDRNTNIIALQVVQTDFRNNTRDTVYFYSEQSELQREFELFDANKIGSSPLFAAGETAQNDRLIAIIEQEFVCVDVPPNIVQMMPSATRFAAQLCSISVPPRHGKMVGYINVWMAKPIDRVHQPYYKSLARSVSDEIYDRDVLGEGR
jgi:hypothetical protein